MTDSDQTHGLLDPAFLRKLERLALIAHQMQAGTARGERRSPRRGVSLEFADYRDYVQGDDLRHVDWNIFARLDSLHLKLFEEREDFTLHLLIDASRSMGFGEPMKLEFAVKLAAAIGYLGLAGYDRVCAAALAGTGASLLPPIRGKGQAGRLFAFLRSVAPEGPTALDAAGRAHFLRHRGKGVAVLISDFFDPAGFEDGLRRLALSGSRAYALHVLAPEEYEPEVSGDIKLVDCETGAEVEVTVSPALLRRYRRRREEYCESVRKFCAGRGIGYFLVTSDTPVERLTLEILRRGGMLR
jgi:uncharacterized protein (DUF58 family)